MPFCDTCGKWLVANEVHPYNHRGKEVCVHCSPTEAVWREPQYITSCENCGADGVKLYSCTVVSADIAIDACGGFSLADSRSLQTADERVKCFRCGFIGPLRYLRKS